MASDYSGIVNKNLKTATDGLDRSTRAISSGKRITSASVDPAGLAIAADLTDKISLSGQARRNISDAVSATEIADGAFQQISDIGSRLSELAAQSANGVLNDNQRGALDSEFQALKQEAQRIVGTTQFNGNPVLQSSSISVQAGVDSSSNSELKVGGVNGQSVVNQLASLDITSQGSARSALDSLSQFTSALSNSRAQQGADRSRMDVAEKNLGSSEVAQQSARSRIEDADIAQEVANRVGEQIKQRSAVAILAQNEASQVSRDTIVRLLY